MKNKLFMATPHKDCAAIAPSDFSSDCANSTPAGWRPPRRICARWRKICKQASRKARSAVFVRCCLRSFTAFFAVLVLFAVSLPEYAEAEEVSILEDYSSKYYYSLLSGQQQEAYSLLTEAVKNHETNIDISEYKLSDSALGMIMTLIKYENPQIFNIDGSATGTGNPVTHNWLTINPNYTRSAAQTKSIRESLESAAEKITAEALKSDDPFERIRVLHDSIVNMTTYTLNGPAYKSEADGPLLNGRALCEGYSKAFAYLCQSIGVPCICIVGSGNGDNHMWNMVQINGDWYHVDVTWDDPVGAAPVLQHDYFCVSTDTILKDHAINNPAAIPTANKDYDGSPSAIDETGTPEVPSGDTVTVNADFSLRLGTGSDLSASVFAYTNRIPQSAYRPIGGELKARFDLGNVGKDAALIYFAGAKYKGQTATLLRYNESDGRVIYVSHAAVDGEGNAALSVSGAGRYFIVSDKTAKLPGDLNGDGNVNAIDAALILRSVANGTAVDAFFGDFNSDGSANAIDAAAILRHNVA